ncbi:MAG: pantoate--beta-alanine ligase [Chloroflexi bacterium]|nr:pantoate--beta-alanine ligase [Chloroflexota bacterium]
MRIVETTSELEGLRTHWIGPVGFVPTMGFLHVGHLSLIERARRECETVVVSIFVNPTQFGPTEDLDRYPRDLPRDLAACEQAGVDVVFAPTASTEIYPVGHRTYVEVHELQDRWEGASRPGHFRGVATVVTMLFELVVPDRAYFGEKDYQQLQIIRRLVRDLRLGAEIVGCPTVREPDGLAYSSRNVYLEGDNRRKAAILYQALRTAQDSVSAGEHQAQTLCDLMRETIQSTSGAEIDYVAVVDSASLAPLEIIEDQARALLAVRIGGVHLIDNVPLRS